MVNLREYDVLESLNFWIGRLFDRQNVDRKVVALVASQVDAAKSGEQDAAKKSLAEAEKGPEAVPERDRGGDKHLFEDSSLDSYDPEAAALLTERITEFLGRVDRS